MGESLLKQKYYGLRPDGTSKGSGYLGEVPMDNKKDVMTELSVGVNIGGKEVLIPSIVPTLSKDDLAYLKKGGNPIKNKALMDKAVEHAIKRMNEGLSPFANDGPSEWKKQ